MQEVIRWEVDKDSISAVAQYSHAIKVEGMDWCILAYTAEKALNLGLKFLPGDFSVRNVAVTFDVIIINHDDPAQSCKWTDEATMHDENPTSGRHLANWETVFDRRPGFIKDNKITVEIVFWLSDIMKSKKRRQIDFTDENEPSHDITLKVGLKNFYVGKQILALHSPAFHSMFYGEFDEKTKKEIELKEIDSEEFCELLHVIYQSGEKINENNFEHLLKLGDRFEIQMVIDKVQQFLIESKMTVAAKLGISDKYKLYKVQIHCLRELKTVKEVTNLKKTKEARNFSEALNNLLLNKIVKLSD